VLIGGIAATVPNNGRPADAFLSALVVLFVVAAARIDMATARIPNKLTYPAFIATLIIIAVISPSALGGALIGSAVASGPLLIAAIAVPSGLGMGDVKLLAVAGLALGFPSALAALMAGILLAGLFSVVGLTIRRLDRRQSVPLGPFLALGIIYALAQAGTVLA
jgi:leader peptidase (prepilin peptidase)/N-methyltransferase